jgi:hypothetical protein
MNLKRIFSLGLVLSALYACNNEQGLFQSLPASKTGIKFQNTLYKKDTFNILYYLYYFNGGGVSTGDINNDGLADVYFTANHPSGNKLYLNKGGMVFEDITEKAGVAGSSEWCTGVTMADVNGDGWLDIYVSAINGVRGLKGRNELFINNKNGTFTESAAQYGLDKAGFTTQTAFFDYDHDGDLDCFIMNHSQRPHQNILDTSHRKDVSEAAGDYLLRNDVAATGKFTDVSAEAGISQSSLGYGLGLAIADFNNDGWEDIYVGNDFHENDYYYINQGNGSFKESGADHFRHYSRFSMGNDAADYDNDGHLDLITVDMLPPDEKTVKTYGSDENLDIYRMKIQQNGYQNQYSRNVLQRNNGNGVSFSDVAVMNNIAATDWSWAPLFADFDNDGVKDLFVSSGIVKRPVDLDYVRYVSSLYAQQNVDNTDKFDDMVIEKMPDGAAHPFFFKGDLQKGFTDVSKDWGTSKMKGYFNGSAYADLDNDGDLDMVINSIDATATVLQNNAKAATYVNIHLRADSGNTFGLGAKVYLFTKEGMQYQQQMLTRGFQSSVAPGLHFGLGKLTSVDSVLIVWPDQTYQLLKDIPAGKTLLAEKKQAAGQFDASKFLPPITSDWVDVTSNINCAWKHKEDIFLDFNKQQLIPHLQSTRGPKIAVADINKDGLDDIYACGANEQPGTLLLQTKPGVFAPIDVPVFGNSLNYEEVDALFFDANNDTWPDLYVVSGGNMYPNASLALADRLFLNDGKGHFQLASANLPATLVNKSCVRASDIDQDGDQDLFVGGLADATYYGAPQTSYLLLNDGKGVFSIADKSVADLNNIGMVTSADFADINKDGWPDLAIAGEWMGVKVYLNNTGKFKAQELPKSTGLWQSVQFADVNADGQLDILAGNWGQNSKLFAGKNGPLKMYVKDFDRNGSVEQVVCYTVDGKEYTFLAKDELERYLPVLKKAYLTYSEVAGKTVDYMFYDLFKDYTELKAETLSSTVFLGDGKGSFTPQILPSAVQASPIFSFMKAGNGFVAAGNFYGVIPYEGRYDALNPTWFALGTNGQTKVKQVVNLSGEVRDMKVVKSANGQQWVVIARNNAPLQFYQAELK